MKPAFSLFVAGFFWGSLLALGINSLKGQPGNASSKVPKPGEWEELFYLQMANDMGQNLILLEKLNSKDVNTAKFILDVSIDGSMSSLYFRKKEKGELAEGQNRMLLRAIEFRRQHPFVRKHDGVDRGEKVENAIKQILEETKR